MRGRTCGVVLVFLGWGCGSSTPAHPAVLPDECEIDAHCGDGVACTEDLCVVSVNARRVCQWIPRTDWCPFGQQCQIIGPGLSGCMFDSDAVCLNATEGTPCTSPDDSCSLGPGKCSGGRCVHPSKACPERPCRSKAGCEPGTLKCRYVPFADGTACDADHSACTTDVCVAGLCRQGTNHCDCETDADCPSGVDVCWGRLACALDTHKCERKGGKACAPLGPCLAGVCNPLTGECDSFPMEDDTPCDPTGPCRSRGVCLDGTCHDAALDCGDDNPCTADGCDPEHGCFNAPIDGACDDGNPCTEGDACADGACRPGPADCDDHNPCTDDACVPDTGCVHEPRDSVPCDSDPCMTSMCVSGTCVPGQKLDCDDHDPCTDDACLPGAGCGHKPLTGPPCDDGDACTLDDTCVEGSCVGGEGPDCNDHNVCTTDGCQSQVGCTHVPAGTGPCDDHDACTASDRCDAGVCLPGPAVSCIDGNPCTADTCDPESGCVHVLLADCCGNSLVETGEECDDGLTGSAACTPNCEFRIQDLVAPPELGRGVTVAWSDAAQTGLVAYERVAQDGTRSLICRTVLAYGNLGAPVSIVDNDAPQVGTLWPKLVAIEGTSTFLLARYTADGIETRLLDAGCETVWKEGKAFVEEIAGSGFVAAQAPGRILLAYHGLVRSGVPGDSGWYSRVHLGVIKGSGADSKLEIPTVAIGGNPALKEQTFAGDICGGDAFSILTIAVQEDGIPHAIRAYTLPLKTFSMIPGDSLATAFMKDDILMPPLCVKKQGGGFAVYFYMRGKLNGFPLIWSVQVSLGPDGNKSEDETIVFPKPDALPLVGPFDVWFPVPGRLLARSEGFLFVSQRFVALDSDLLTVSNVRLSILPLDATGAIPGTHADVTQVPSGFIRALDAAPLPSDRSILAWQEGQKAVTAVPEPGGPVRLVIRSNAQ